MEAEDDAQKEHLLVYLTVSRIIDIIRRVKHRQLSTACAKPMLLSGIAAWLELHKAKYGKAHIKPKCGCGSSRSGWGISSGCSICSASRDSIKEVEHKQSW